MIWKTVVAMSQAEQADNPCWLEKVGPGQSDDPVSEPAEGILAPLLSDQGLLAGRSSVFGDAVELDDEPPIPDEEVDPGDERAMLVADLDLLLGRRQPDRGKHQPAPGLPDGLASAIGKLDDLGYRRAPSTRGLTTSQLLPAYHAASKSRFCCDHRGPCSGAVTRLEHCQFSGNHRYAVALRHIVIRNGRVHPDRPGTAALPGADAAYVHRAKVGMENRQPPPNQR